MSPTFSARRLLGSPRRLGTLVLIGVLLFGVVAFQKDRIASVFSRGDTIEAVFARDYKLEIYQSKVKLAGAGVGEVTGIERRGGEAVVSMRIDPGIRGKLGGRPSAEVRPTLVLGGVYYIELVPGGKGGVFNGTVPMERTSVPVELDPVLAAVNPPQARRGLQSTTRQLDATLQQGGRAAIQRFIHDTPEYMDAATQVLTAAQGTDPGQDLTRLVSGLEGASATLTHKDGQLVEIVDSLRSTTAALAAQRKPVADFIESTPETLRTTRAGLTDLRGTLDRLTEVAPDARPTAQRLDPLFARLGPVVERARPVVGDLRAVLGDARPMLENLTPSADQTTQALQDLRGPVLDRVNGPLLTFMNRRWHGTGPTYGGDGNDHRFYEELAYMSSHAANSFKFFSPHGALARLMAGVGVSTATGGAAFPPTLERLLEANGANQPPGPQDSKPDQGGLPLLGGTK